MQYKLFQYPLPSTGELEDLNQFLASHRVAVVQHHVVRNSSGSMLIFVVECVGAATERLPSGRPPKIDYREKLSESQFAIFSRLRDERKKIADGEGVPVYAVFTNAQLAEMVTRPVRTEAELIQVEGIGEGKAKKFAARLLPILVARDGVPSDSLP